MLTKWLGRERRGKLDKVERERGRWIALLNVRGKFFGMLRKMAMSWQRKTFNISLDHKVSTKVQMCSVGCDNMCARAFSSVK